MIPHLLRCQGLALKNLRLRPWTPWSWGILGFCNTRVKHRCRGLPQGKTGPFLPEFSLLLA